jgi:hypothetical protein
MNCREPMSLRAGPRDRLSLDRRAANESALLGHHAPARGARTPGPDPSRMAHMSCKMGVSAQITGSLQTGGPTRLGYDDRRSEGWQSGRMRRSRKPLSVQADRRFKSSPLRSPGRKPHGSVVDGLATLPRVIRQNQQENTQCDRSCYFRMIEGRGCSEPVAPRSLPGHKSCGRRGCPPT